METGKDEFPLDDFVAGKRTRFNRIDFVSFAVVSSLDDISKRLVIDDVEQGNGISISKIKIFNL